jgi:hypothetical protein
VSEGAEPQASGVAQAALVVEFKGMNKFPGPFLSAQLKIKGFHKFKII